MSGLVLVVLVVSVSANSRITTAQHPAVRKCPVWLVEWVGVALVVVVVVVVVLGGTL